MPYHVPPLCGSSPFDRLLYSIWATGVKLGPTGLYSILACRSFQKGIQICIYPPHIQQRSSAGNVFQYIQISLLPSFLSPTQSTSFPSYFQPHALTQFLPSSFIHFFHLRHVPPLLCTFHLHTLTQFLPSSFIHSFHSTSTYVLSFVFSYFQPHVYLLSSCHLPSFFPFPYTTYVLSFVLFTLTHLLTSCLFLHSFLYCFHSTFTYFLSFVFPTSCTYSVLAFFLHSFLSFDLQVFSIFYFYQQYIGFAFTSSASWAPIKRLKSPGIDSLVSLKVYKFGLMFLSYFPFMSP